MIRNRNIFLVMGFLALAALSGCGGGAGGVEAGNPSQLVIGSLQDADCGADRAVATDSAGNSVSTVIAPDCSFELNLPVPGAWLLDFTSGGTAAASASFDNSPKRFLSPAMNLSGGDTIFLDRVSFYDGEASPSAEPSAQSDQDRNGLPDLFDQDDDADGIPDEDEADCDLDGIIDDFDAATSDCAPDSAVSEVSPRNGEGTGAHGSKVKTNKDVRIRFSCTIDPSTLTPSTLEIFPEDDPDAISSCDFTVLGTGKLLRCAHPDFSADTIYDARLEGVRCEDGSEIPAVSWSWKTR
ncbi:MAG TPA: hypothetical protein VFX30_14470 [bacterium]|nr:hypothetical protein [bacterium]